MILLPPLPERRRVWQQQQPPAGAEPPAALYIIPPGFLPPPSPCCCCPPSPACVRAAHPAVTATCAPPMGRLDGKAAAAPSARGRRWRRLQAPGRPRWRRERRQQQSRQPPPPLLRLPTPRSQRLSQQQRLQQKRQLRPRNVNGCLVAGLRAPHNTTQFLMCDEYRREGLRGDFTGPAAPRDAGDLDGYSRALERARGGGGPGPGWGGGLVGPPVCVPTRDWRSSAAGDGLAEASYEPAHEDWSRTEDFMARDFATVYREAGCA